jgi:anti-sigma factor RsiW
MINCIQARRRLDMYMDNELSVPENLEVLEHLNLCLACRDVFGTEERLRVILKAELSSPAPPARLAGRIRMALRGSPRTSRWVLPWQNWKFAAAASIVAAVIAIVFLIPTRQGLQALAAEVVARHDLVRPEFFDLPHPDTLRVQGNDPQTLAEFFHRYVTYEVCLHDLKPLGFRPVGGSMWKHREGWVCWTTDRDSRGHTISHALIAFSSSMESKPILVVRGGRSVLFVPNKELAKTCVFVFDDRSDADAFMSLMKMVAGEVK